MKLRSQTPRLYSTAVAVLFVATALSGCLFQPSPSDTQCRINRILSVTIDTSAQAASTSENRNSWDDFYDKVKPSFKITMRASGAPSSFQVRYQDQEGETRTRPLSDFTSAGEVSQAPVITVPNTNFTSFGSVIKDGQPLCTRGAALRDWWKVGGTEIGFLMEPGARLEYETTASGTVGGTVTNVDWTPPDSEQNVHVQGAQLDFTTDGTGTLSFDQASATTEVQGSEGPVDAYELAWALSSTTRFPGSFIFDSTADGEEFDFGIEARNTAASVAMAGTLGVDSDRNVVNVALGGGHASLQGKIIAYSNREDFPLCGGRTQAEECVPEQFEGIFPIEKEIPASSLPIPTGPAPDATARQVAQAFFGEVAQEGDELSLDVRTTGASLGSLSALGGVSQDSSITIRFTLKVTGVEDVTVPAGTFHTLVVVQELVVVVDAPSASGGGVNIQETISRVTSWLEASSFVVVKVRGESPVDYDKLVKDLVDGAIPESAWESLGIAKPDPSSYALTLSGTTNVELKSLSGTSAMAPWVGVMLAQVMPALVGSSFSALSLSGLGGLGGTATPVEPVVTASVSASTYDSDANGLADGVALTLAEASGATITGIDVFVTADGHGADLYKNPERTELLAPSDEWVVGDTIGFACSASELNVVVTIRATTVLTQTVACDEYVEAPLEFIALPYDNTVDGDELTDGIAVTLLSDTTLEAGDYEILLDGAAVGAYADEVWTEPATTWSTFESVFVPCPGAGSFELQVDARGETAVYVAAVTCDEAAE